MKKTTVLHLFLIVLVLLIVDSNTQSFCPFDINSYWTGYRCACKVGYKNQTNICVPLTLTKTQYWVVR